MEESDSEREDDPPARATDVPYPLEGKYIDEADKRKIMGMSQLDREEILGQRAEEMSRANFTAELARRAANLHNDRKRKVDSEEPDEGSSSRRPKVKARVNDKLEEYKRNREQRGQQRDRDADRLNSRRRSSSGDRDGPSDMDADGESDVEWDDRAPAKAREELPATLRDFDSVRVGRGFFSEVCFYPGFEEAVTGTFGRVGVGQDAQRRTMYKMAQIKGAWANPTITATPRASLTTHRHQHGQALRLRGQERRKDRNRPIRRRPARLHQEGLPVPVPLQPALRRPRPRHVPRLAPGDRRQSPRQVVPRAQVRRPQGPAQPPLDRARDQRAHRKGEAVRPSAAPEQRRRGAAHPDPERGRCAQDGRAEQDQ